MLTDDDEYVSVWYASVEDVARDADVDAHEIRRLMLANRVPLPSYIRSDGAQMVPRDLLSLLERAGGADALPSWFAAHWTSAADAVDEWDAYLSGQFVCLRVVDPENIQRKGELTEVIDRLITAPDPESRAWREELHAHVDELDALEPPFARYDRLRFGGPVSRDRLIDDVRRRFPRAGDESVHEVRESSRRRPAGEALGRQLPRPGSGAPDVG